MVQEVVLQVEEEWQRLHQCRQVQLGPASDDQKDECTERQSS